MSKFIISYIKYLRNSSEEVKFIHAVVFASVATGIFIAVYLYLVRGTSPAAYLFEDKTYISE